MNEWKLNLVLKGARNYVQGPTMLDETVKLLLDAGYKQMSNLDFQIHRMTGSNLRLHVEPHRENTSATDDVAVLKFVTNGQPMQARISADVGVPETRVPYDESAVVDRCEIDTADRNIRLLNNDSGFSPIEVLVSMNKALHLAALKKPPETSWVFCRWSSPEWPLPADLNRVTVTLKQTLGTRLTCSEVQLGERTLGQVFFSARAAS